MQIKTIKCDICGKDMTNEQYPDECKLTMEEVNDGIRKPLDVCFECRTKIVTDVLVNKDLSYLKNPNKIRKIYFHFYC